MDGYAVGRRIAYWRERRRLTQADFGALMGQSRRWVQSLESGVRQADPRLSVLENAARVLRIPLVWLLSGPADAERVDAVELEAIRAVLYRHDVITSTAADGDEAAEPVALDVLRRQVAYGWDAFQASRFTLLSRLLPELLTRTNRAAARYTGEDQTVAYCALAMALCLTEAVCVKFGSGPLAALAGRRAVVVAERCGDAAVMATAACHLCDAMTEDGQPAAAARFATAAAARLEPYLVSAGPAGLSALGALYLKAAMAQATLAADNSSTASDAARAVPALLDRAAQHAARLDGANNALWSAFNAANVSLYRLATHVQLAQGAEAVAVATSMPAPDIDQLPRERRAHRLVDLAHAYTLAGQRTAAVDALLAAEREAAEEVRSRPRTRRLIEELSLLGTGNAEARLRALAGRCGLP
ncbi:helix-turn-helix domain-containing protein [Streptomyces minutiscleroticus]|uniref:helix-turn-helix domain-containing protein n=2 Tax=Streptomyces minutiscleroticus TaxID=68238 RepID=UPI00331C519C